MKVWMDAAKVFNRGEEELGAFGARMRRLGDAVGAKAFGCSYYEIDPGKMAFPFHFHIANEESILVVAGTGTMRIGEDEVAVRGGDSALLVELANELQNVALSLRQVLHGSFSLAKEQYRR